MLVEKTHWAFIVSFGATIRVDIKNLNLTSKLCYPGA